MSVRPDKNPPPHQWHDVTYKNGMATCHTCKDAYFSGEGDNVAKPPAQEQRCPSTVFDRAIGQPARCIDPLGHPGHHSDGVMGWAPGEPAEQPTRRIRDHGPGDCEIKGCGLPRYFFEARQRHTPVCAVHAWERITAALADEESP